MNGANPVLTIPSAKKVGDELLTASFEQHTEKKYLVMQKDHAFVAVAFDGWSNLKREKMINVVASSPNMGVVHIKTIAVGFDSQTGKYIARLMIREISELEDVIGPGKVASCTTDSAGNMEKAWEILEKRGIFCNGCAAHTSNLLLQDVAKLDEVKAVAAGAEAFTAYFMGRHKLLARFKAAKLELAQSGSTNVHGRSFTIPVATRWYSAYQCLVNVIRNREAITNVFDDEELMESYKGIKKRRVVLVPAPTKASRKSNRTKKMSRKVQENADQQQQQKSAKEIAFEKVETIVRDENFWEKGEQVIKLLEPIIEKLGLMEADGTCISLVYWAFNDLLKKPIYRSPTVLVDAAKQIHALIKARWDKMHTDAMGIAYFLDPSQDPRGFVDDDRNKTKNQIRKVAKRLGFSKDEVDQCFKEAGVFWNRKRDWTPKQRRTESRTAPLEWWGEERDKYPILSRIARRIFTMPPSSAATERNGSTHKYIYSSCRSQLGLEKVNMLVSLYWSHMEKKPLPPVVYNPATLGDDPTIENVPSVYFDADDSDDDDDDDDVSSSSDDEDFDEDADDEDSEEVNSAARAEQDIVIQEPLDYYIDNTYDYLGEHL